MAIDVRYGANPFILGKAAEAAGAAGSYLDNRRMTAEAQQRAGLQASSIAASQDAQAASQAFQGQQREADRDSDAAKYVYGATIEDQWRKRQLESQALQQQQHDAAVMQQTEKRNRAEFVQQGLKDGTLYHDPKMSEQLATIQRERATTMANPAISDDVKQKMLAQYDQAFDSIYMNPQVNTKPQQPFHESVGGQMALLDAKTGKLLPIGTKQPERGDKIVSVARGDPRITEFDKSSQQSESVDKEILTPKYQTARLGELLTNIKDERKFERDNAIALADADIDEADTVLSSLNSTPEQMNAAKAAKLAALQRKKAVLSQPVKMPTIMEARQRLEEEMNTQTVPQQQQGPVRLNSMDELNAAPKGTYIVGNEVFEVE